MMIQKWISRLSLIGVLIFLPCVLQADPLDHWYWRNPLPQGNTLDAVVYRNGTFVAVGAAGTVLTSDDDGESWTFIASGTDDWLQDITYGNGTYVAVGWDGAILTSQDDGVTWTSRISGTTKGLGGITYANGTFVAVGVGGILLTSADGVNWTPRNSGTTTRLNGISYGKGTFVAVGCIGTVVTSTDGVNWTPRNSGIDEWLDAITYSNGTFVAVGEKGTILTSSDGATWISRFSGTDRWLSRATYGEGTFIVAGDIGVILTSPDGATWTLRTSGTTYSMYGISYGGGNFVAVGYHGAILTSPDGLKWTSRISGADDYLDGIAYGNGTFVAVGFDGAILTSKDDGVTWTPRASGTTRSLYGITYANDTFVVVGSYGTILTSASGVTWTSRVAGTTRHLRGVTYGNSAFVAVGDYGETLTSSDGVTWTPRTSGTTRPLNGVIYAYNTFVAVGSGGVILTSQDDGVTWTHRISATNHDLNGVTYGDGTFVAVGYGGTILQSDSFEPSPPVECKVSTSPAGLEIIVDESPYTCPQTFNWTAGSSHTLCASSPQSVTPGTQYVFSSWSNGGTQCHTITTPSSRITYTASFQTQYALTTSANPSEGGTVTPTGENWYNKGKTVAVSAKANPGYGFSRWSGDISGKVNPKSITMNGPKNVVANFSLKVTLLGPNGGEAIPSGSLYPVSWVAPPQAVKFKLSYSMDNGTTWMPIHNDFVTGSSYDWMVPTPMGNMKKCLVKLVGYDASNRKVGSDTSDAPFTVEVLKLTYPNLPENFASGSKVVITWTTNATKKPVAKTTLYYTKDAGVTWSQIKAFNGDPNPRSHVWTVPVVGKAKTNCKVKVVLKDSNGGDLGNDVSDAYFTISPP